MQSQSGNFQTVFVMKCLKRIIIFWQINKNTFFCVFIPGETEIVICFVKWPPVLNLLHFLRLKQVQKEIAGTIGWRCCSTRQDNYKKRYFEKAAKISLVNIVTQKKMFDGVFFCKYSTTYKLLRCAFALSCLKPKIQPSLVWVLHFSQSPLNAGKICHLAVEEKGGDLLAGFQYCERHLFFCQ